MKKLSVLLLALIAASGVKAQSSSFTYQGRLNDGSSPANGSYDLMFAVFDAVTGSNQIGGVLTNAATAVSNGLFTVTLDFGAGVFTGADRWLEIGVVTNGGGAFATLSPRQQVTATPYAIQAANAATAGSAATANSVNASNILGPLALAQLPDGLVTNGARGLTLAGSFSGDGAGLTNLSPGSINGILSPAQIPGLDGSKITSGTVSLDRLPASLITNGASGVTFAGTFSGNGAGLTNVDLLNINSRGGISWQAKASGVFSNAGSAAVGGSPRSVIIADMNGDGTLDLVSANSFGNTLSVLTNKGNGTFALASSPGVGAGPYSVVAIDINGDGKLELACANANSATVSVLTNGGGGVFTVASTLGVGSGPLSVTAADVNGDGRMDLISANNGSGSLTILTNNGSGSFVLASSPVVAPGPYFVTATDVNGDGKVDLISASPGNNAVTVLTNNGTGNFALAATLSVSGGPISVTAADVNGDGKVDLITANNSAGTMTILTNNGSGSFVAAGTSTAGSGAFSVAAVDINGDGKLDLICANANANTLSLLTNNGSGGFALASSPVVGITPVSVAAGDLNGDGAPDLVTANLNANSLSILFNTGAIVTPVFLNLNASNLTSGTIPDARLSANVVLESGPNVFSGTNRFSSVLLATNSDNQFGGNGAGLTGVDLRAANSFGAMSWTTNVFYQLFSSPVVGTSPRSVVAADINGDGKVDLISAMSGSGIISVLTNNGSAVFGSVPTPLPSSAPYWVAVADVNGDSKLDVITANFNNNTLSVFTNNGSGSLALWSTPSLSSGPVAVVAVDVNADGRMDLITANPNASTLSVLTNTGSAFVLSATLLVGSTPENLAAADINGDGKIDLISANYNSGSLTVLTNNGSGNFVFYATIFLSTGPYFVKAVDVNNDGRMDLVAANPSSSTISICLNNGGGSFSINTISVPGSPINVASADVNGDGKVDLITANNSGSSLSLLTNNGSGGFAISSTIGVGPLPFAVAVGDLTGDGRADLISANNGGNTLSVLLNSMVNGASFAGNGAGLTNLIVTAANITSGTLADARLSSNIPRLNANNEFTGTNGLNDKDIHFRNSADGNHGVGWYGSTGPIKTFAGFGPDGPILYGFQSGGLGTTSGGQTLALMWNSLGRVGIGKTSPATALDVNGTVAASSGSFGGTVSANSFSGSSASISGTVSASALDVSGAVTAINFSGSGAGLTLLNASNLVGILADAVLSTNVALLGGTNVFTQTNQFAGVVVATNAANQFVGSFAGGGAGLTNVPATNLTGVLTSAQIPNLDASIITSGSLVDGRLSTNVALRSGGNTFDGNQVFNNGYLGIGTAAPNRPLQIGSTTTATNALVRFACGNGTALRQWELGVQYGGTNTASPNYDFAITDVTAAATRFLVDWQTGNVGIGTNDPASKLHVLGGGIFSGSVSAASFAGDGSALTNLNAGNVSSGTLADARLSANVTLLNGTNVFTGTNRFAGVVLATNANNQFAGVFAGTGAGLTNLFPTNLVGTLPINTTLKFAGDRTNGIANPVLLVNNTNTSSSAAPALRVQNDGGTTPNGALSVSANVSATAANSVIAQFGNASSFVVTITNDGTIYSKGVALTSDRNAKQSFSAVNGKLVLEKVASLPMTEWDYKDTPGIRHLGPMAQDFHAAFGLNGSDDHHISVVDEGGVALAAIQGLNEKFEESTEKGEGRITQLEQENAQLKARLEKLERLLTR